MLQRHCLCITGSPSSTPLPRVLPPSRLQFGCQRRRRQARPPHQGAISPRGREAEGASTVRRGATLGAQAAAWLLCRTHPRAVECRRVSANACPLCLPPTPTPSSHGTWEKLTGKKAESRAHLEQFKQASAQRRLAHAHSAPFARPALAGMRAPGWRHACVQTIHELRATRVLFSCLCSCIHFLCFPLLRSTTRRSRSAWRRCAPSCAHEDIAWHRWASTAVFWPQRAALRLPTHAAPLRCRAPPTPACHAVPGAVAGGELDEQPRRELRHLVGGAGS